MEQFIVILYVIMFVWGVLNIILFFKIWIMTNNVSAIRNKLNNETDFSCLATGNKEEIKKLLISLFTAEVKSIVDQTLSGDIGRQINQKFIERIVSKYQNKAEALNIDINFKSLENDIFTRIETVVK